MLIAFDLDDTLYSEKDYVRSSYRAIAAEWGEHLLPAMMAAPTPAAAFDSTGLPIERLLEIYRTHFPDIKLNDATRDLLEKLVREGNHIAIITDGRSLTQRHKVEALGLDRFVAPEDVLISEEIGGDKLTGLPFKILNERYPDISPKVYVGDNPAKDFLMANREGWITLCLLDRGNNIHRQYFDLVGREYWPKFALHSLSELCEVVDLVVTCKI